jgi:hypothetical protein
MTLAEVRILSGMAWAVGACVATIRIGDKPERRVAILMAADWVVTTAVQFLSGLMYEPVIIAHFAFGAVLLWFAARYNKAWLWVMTLIAAILFFMHALLYRPSHPVGLLHLVVGDAVAWGAPLFLLIVALRNRNRRKSGAMPTAPTGQIAGSVLVAESFSD